MRGIIMATISTLAFVPTQVRADVSHDLVFCSKLTSPRERIACYDAAARIAARSTAPAAAASPARMVTRDAADHPPPYLPPVERNPFGGAYLALGGAYGISNGRTAVNGAPFGSLQETVYAQGWSGIGAIGYNATIGRFLFGLELSGRYGRESASITQLDPATGPATGFQTLSYSIKSDAGAHLAARFGVIVDQTLVFAKAGVGASHILETATADLRGIDQCGPIFQAVCPFLNSPTLRQASTSHWAPSVIFGAGIEHNFGPFFARAEAEIEAVPLHETRSRNLGTATSEQYWTARAMMAAGFRF